MKRIVATVAAVVLAFSLAACGGEATDVPDKGDRVTYVEVDRPDGTTVECVVYQGYLEGSIDCGFPKESN